MVWRRRPVEIWMRSGHIDDILIVWIFTSKNKNRISLVIFKLFRNYWKTRLSTQIWKTSKEKLLFIMQFKIILNVLNYFSMTKEPIHLLSKTNIFLSSKYPNKIMFLFLFPYSQNCQNSTPSSIFTFTLFFLSFFLI